MLLERPLALLAVLAAIDFLFLRRWANLRTTASLRWVGGGLLLTLVLPLASVLIVTDRERIEAVCRRATRAVDDSDMAALALLIDDSFELDGRGKVEFLQSVERGLLRYRIDQARLSKLTVTTLAEHEAVVEFSVTCLVRSAEMVYDAALTRWKVTLARRGGDWRIGKVESAPVAPFYFRDLEERLGR